MEGPEHQHLELNGSMGLRLKQIVLAFGATYLGMVSLTNAINFVNHAVGQHWTFLNSHNANDIASIVKVYGWPT